MRVGVIGINHKLADLDLRERLAQACQRSFAIGSAVAGPHTFILLSTCNRIEIYFSSQDLSETHIYLLSLLRQEGLEDFDQKIYSYFGQDCFYHLCRVTAGLDSAIVAETEIQGQVKIAYEKASACLELPSVLHYLFQKSLAIGKQVRSGLTLGRGMPDLEHAILTVGQNLFEFPQHCKILFVGASEVNCKVWKFLQSQQIADISLTNRSHQQAVTMANEYGLKCVNWASINQWHLFDWIIFGTKAPSFLISANQITKRIENPKLLIDLSVPRNVDPLLGQCPNITLLNIDQINLILKERKLHMTVALQEAEITVLYKVQQYSELYSKKTEVMVALS